MPRTRTLAIAVLALLFATTFTPSVRADKTSASHKEYGATRTVVYSATQKVSSGWFTAHVRWSNGRGSLTTTSGVSTKSVKASAIQPRVSGHGISLSASISTGGGGIGAASRSGTCNLGEFRSDGKTVTVINAGELCDISSHVLVRSGDVHVTAKSQYGGTWVTFEA